MIYNEEKPNDELITKVCSHCKKEKSVSEFYTDVNSKDGYRAQCKECAREAAKASALKAKAARQAEKEVSKALKESKTYRELSLLEKKQLLLQLRSDKPLSAYHPRELFEYLASLGYKIKAEYVQTLNFG